MKKFTQKKVLPFYGICLVFLGYACQNKEAEPLQPYSTEALTKELKGLSLPSFKQLRAAQVTTTAATITPSPTATSVYSGIAGIPSAGTVPAVVTQAVGDMNTALSQAGATATDVNTAFTPQVLNNLAAGGQLPGSLQTTVNTLTASSVLQPYLPTFTYPTVNGQQVGPTTSSVNGPTPVTLQVGAITVKPINYSGGDDCFKAANDLFDQKIASFPAELIAQLGTINTIYSQDKTAAENERPGCVSDKQSQYTSTIVTSKQNLANNLAYLNASQNTLGTASYNTLKALIYVLYSYDIQLYYKVQTAEINACSIKADVQLAEVKVTRDTALNTAKTNFNNTVTAAQTLVLKLYDSCHNQGSAR